MHLIEQHHHRRHLFQVKSAVDNKTPEQFVKNLNKRRDKRMENMSFTRNNYLK